MENCGLLWIFCVQHVDGLMGQPSALWLLWLKDVCTMLPLWIPGLKVDTVDKIGEWLETEKWGTPPCLKHFGHFLENLTLNQAAWIERCHYHSCVRPDIGICQSLNAQQSLTNKTLFSQFQSKHGLFSFSLIGQFKTLATAASQGKALVAVVTQRQ